MLFRSDDNFPEHLTLRDIVRAIELGIQALEFKKINILIGGSLGGMQAMELLYNRQFEVEKAIILAATDKTSSYSRAFNEIARQAIRSEEHTSELQSPNCISYAVFCLKKKKQR